MKNCTGIFCPMQCGTVDPATCQAVDYCPQATPPKTNADRIRAMSDEELAKFLCHNVSNGTINCAFCAVEEFCHFGHNGWIDWLKQEADDDTQNV